VARIRLPKDLGLRQRMVVFFSLTALVAALSLSVVTYFSTRSYLLEQRTLIAQRQAFNNAQLMRSLISTADADIAELITQIRTEQGGFAVLLQQQTADRGELFFAQSPLRFSQSDLPQELVAGTQEGLTGHQRFSFADNPYEAVGVVIPSIGVVYYEVFPISDVANTLRTILATLVVGVVLITAGAGVLGFTMSQSVLRPLRRVAKAANEIATGGLDTRLSHEEDTDLEKLVLSFNEMANAVQTRIEREQRFASDVSHELRSPVTALTAAIEVLVSRRDEFTARNQQAIDIIKKQVERFDRTVIDLLELSRLDAGALTQEVERVQINDLVLRIMNRYGFGSIPLHSEISGSDGEIASDDEIVLDRRRIERIVVNLLENARDHALGATRITLNIDDGVLTLGVHDAGPGVAVSERTNIFDRFARGTASRNSTGSGLGLAIVREHVRAMSGTVHVEDSSEGGSSFIVTFPTGGVS